jgi:hypothetical protein
MSRTNIKTVFDYGALPERVAATMREAAGRIRQHRHAVQSAAIPRSGRSARHDR